MLYGNRIADLAAICPKAKAFIDKNDLASLQPGKYDLGEGDFVNILCAKTRPREESQYESHVNYIDIQMPIEGYELCEVAPIEDAKVSTPYSEADDIAFHSNAHEDMQYLLEPGTFILLMPQDAHMPTLAIDEPEPIKKAVFKIRVENYV
ncbi:MAG: YhcH/YjgK/YiaL family protein [Eggerthellaceae bacterium]|nr:YhcH/YjgK/YiaL family protein [Eggerthellaceae bacterium]